MTCIAAFVDHGNVYMGGDSAGVNPNNQDLQLCRQPKVFKKDNLLIGVSGSFPAMEALRSIEWPTPALGHDRYGWVVRSMGLFLRGAIPTEEEKLTEILIGFQGHIYHYYGARQVVEETLPFEAIGCAAQVARGAFYGIESSPGKFIPPQSKVLRALEAAERFSAGVRAPFTIITDARSSDESTLHNRRKESTQTLG